VADAADEQIAQGGVDDGFGDVEASFVAADEATVVGEPAEAALEWVRLPLTFQPLEQHPVSWNRFQRSNDRVKLLYRL